MGDSFRNVSFFFLARKSKGNKWAKHVYNVCHARSCWIPFRGVFISWITWSKIFADLASILLWTESLHNEIVLNCKSNETPIITQTMTLANGNSKFPAIVWGFVALEILSATKYDASMTVKFCFWFLPPISKMVFLSSSTLLLK